MEFTFLLFKIPESPWSRDRNDAALRDSCSATSRHSIGSIAQV